MLITESGWSVFHFTMSRNALRLRPLDKRVHRQVESWLVLNVYKTFSLAAKLKNSHFSILSSRLLEDRLSIRTIFIFWKSFEAFWSLPLTKILNDATGGQVLIEASLFWRKLFPSLADRLGSCIESPFYNLNNVCRILSLLNKPISCLSFWFWLFSPDWTDQTDCQCDQKSFSRCLAREYGVAVYIHWTPFSMVIKLRSKPNWKA